MKALSAVLISHYIFNFFYSLSAWYLPSEVQVFICQTDCILHIWEITYHIHVLLKVEIFLLSTFYSTTSISKSNLWYWQIKWNKCLLYQNAELLPAKGRKLKRKKRDGNMIISIFRTLICIRDKQIFYSFNESNLRYFSYTGIF